MPEKTKTGKWIFPIRDASSMKKDGWFTRDTNTKGVSVRLARLKSNDTVVVQAYIFDTKEGWDKAKAEKWLKGQDIKWLATLQEHEDTFNGKCTKIVMVISGDDMSNLMSCDEDEDEDEESIGEGSDEEDRDQKKTNSENITKEVDMAEQVEFIANDGSGLVPIKVDDDPGMPTEIVKVPKRIVTHRSKKKGSNGKPLNLNGKDYGRNGQSSMNSTEVSNDLNKCNTDEDDEKKKLSKHGDKDNDDKKKKMVRTPKKK